VDVSKIFHEIGQMPKHLPAWRFVALWLIGLIAASAWLCIGVSSLITSIRWW